MKKTTTIKSSKSAKEKSKHNIALCIQNDGPKIHSHFIANNLGIQQQSYIQNIEKHASHFNKLRMLIFEMEHLVRRGRQKRYAAFNALFVADNYKDGYQHEKEEAPAGS